MTRRTVKLVLQYDGTGLAGWQRQPNGETVQERLEEALAAQLGEEIRTVAAGRTDAGVHALGQVVSFRTRSGMPLPGIVHGTNARLPAGIAVQSAEDVPSSFHARKSARGKVYRYRILERPTPGPLFERFALRVARPLDVRAMRRAADPLLGTHDFSSFRNAGSVETSPVRTLRRIDIACEGDCLSMDFEGDGFLYRMVRNLVGTLLLAGQGRLDPSRVGGILAARDRDLAGPTAPARGLCLLEVIYGSDA